RGLLHLGGGHARRGAGAPAHALGPPPALARRGAPDPDRLPWPDLRGRPLADRRDRRLPARSFLGGLRALAAGALPPHAQPNLVSPAASGPEDGRLMSLTVDRANWGAKRATTTPLYRALARAGYVARGVLYAYMGYAAFQIALTQVPQRADQQQSLVVVSGFPLGRLILLAGVVSLAAYSLWGFIRAVYDPLRRGRDPVGIVTRLGFAWSGLTYAALLFFATALLTHGPSSQGDQVQQLAARLLAAPFGPLLTEGVGLVGVAAGLGQFVEIGRAHV